MLKTLKKLFKKKKNEEEKKPTNYDKHKTIPLNLESLDRTLEQKETSSKSIYKVTSHIPIIDDPSRREYNTPFRKSGDENNVARINQKAPKGTPKKVAEFVAVAGISFQEKNVMKVISSDYYSFELEKDPDNPYDKYAIKVLGIAGNNEEESILVGYIPKELAKKLSEYEILKPTLRLIYFPSASNSVGLRLDI